MTLAQKAVESWNRGAPADAAAVLRELADANPRTWPDLLADANPPREMMAALIRIHLEIVTPQ